MNMKPFITILLKKLLTTAVVQDDGCVDLDWDPPAMAYLCPVNELELHLYAYRWNQSVTHSSSSLTTNTAARAQGRRMRAMPVVLWALGSGG